MSMLSDWHQYFLFLLLISLLFVRTKNFTPLVVTSMVVITPLLFVLGFVLGTQVNGSPQSILCFDFILALRNNDRSNCGIDL